MRFQGKYSRRDMLRGSAVTMVGAGALAIVSCGDDDDDEPEATATTAPDGNGSDGGDEPVEFKLVKGWYKGEEVVYYDFGMNTPLGANLTVATAPIYVFTNGTNADGSPAFVEGQHNIVTVVPGDPGYSDLWQVNIVSVDDDYEADSIKSKADIDAAGLTVTPMELYVNCPIVPEGSTFENGETLVQGWKDGEAVFYPDFGMNPPVAIPIWVFATGMDSSGNPVFVDGQMNVIDSVPGDAGYSAFWNVNLVMVDEDYEANTAKSAQDVRDMGYEVMQTELMVNCPVVEA